MNSKIAVLFPGQGAHSSEMLCSIRNAEGFEHFHRIICDEIGFNLLKKFEQNDQNVINSNLLSSVGTILASAVALKKFKEESEAEAYAGYSIGTYTSLYANDILDFDQMIHLVKIRAQLMDDCFQGVGAGMMSIIGLKLIDIEDVCDELRNKGEKIFVSNINCFGQYTLAGLLKSLAIAEKDFINLGAKKVQILPVNGAWHSKFLTDASKKFSEVLKSIKLKMPAKPMINNVDGSYMPKDEDLIKEQLTLHIDHPVHWEKGISTLINDGCKEFIEMGYGNVLTKFGFFINRQVKHIQFSG